MQHLTHASRELFRRTPDETFPTLAALVDHCRKEREDSVEHWHPPNRLWARSVKTGQLLLGLEPSMPTSGGPRPEVADDADGTPLALAERENEAMGMTDWSFGQLCRLAGVSKDTVNRLSPPTASRVFAETLPRGNKPLQVFSVGNQARSIHGASYTRLHNAELLEAVRDCADGFEAPPKGANGGTGLYCGEQDMFAFLIDPGGWTEIGGEAFAPGMFLWNSEVGRRSLGIQTFWYQSICANHIVWDAIEVVEFSRKHTASVHESLGELKRIIQSLVAKRDARRDGFARVIQKAMETRLGEDADEVQDALTKNGIGRTVAQQAVELAGEQGRFTVFAVVDALTRLAGKIVNAGERTELDQRAGRLLSLAV